MSLNSITALSGNVKRDVLVINIIGFIISKLITLLTILFPSVDTSDKVILVVIWLMKLLIDYDAARPGHSGTIYRFTQKVEVEVGELMVAFVQFILAAIFLTVTVLVKAWITFIPGVVGVLIHFASIVCCIKDIIIVSKRRSGRNANTNHKK